MNVDADNLSGAAVVVETTNVIILAVGGAVVLAAIGYWGLRGRRDPLGVSPDRPNKVGFEGVLLPALVWVLTGGVGGMLVDRWVGGDRLEIAMIWCGNVAQLFGGLACLYVAAATFGGGVRRFVFGQTSVVRQVGVGVVYWVAALAICQWVLYVTLQGLTWIDPNYDYRQHEVINVLREGKVPMITLWIGTVFVAPVAEELFFRGIMQTALENVVRSRWVCVLLSAAIFGTIHAGGGDNPQPHVVPALAVLAVLLGVLYERTGSLVGPIVLHMLFNAKTLVFETLAPGGL